MPTDHPVLTHLITADAWEASRGSTHLRPPSLAEAGFVHLSTPQQVHLPANRLFAGRRDLLLLVLDPARLDAEIRWEPGVPTDPASMLFPHLYGPLPLDAVVEVREYLPGPDNAFAPVAG
ncbi:DUF952 domain-containing protein [Gordonia paraffinivorans]|uniref:Glutathione S-transferase n=2 Tax=Gordonia paraffinivorans TaxID=175628 RepID=A0ABQ0IH93_9ACTN|nr:DUF952 domain-containing protein [Gordonia paraffinivorans]MBY4572291.1 glutathione S-transferase [Gordonia paraffinivorans]MCD2147280.1 DUF952 domain-containing protein [Gordonia paraffinivorans]PWD44103.1 glutathione S-transferase [Gordonia paraffinivorans]VFA82299.1 Uncharacterized protein conserved in bacteria [Gordonia paraffinivorans]GAC82924.1 hypothetical protein GP2_006_00790 [Gordonia paraffinivorans NBRC 108238]